MVGGNCIKADNKLKQEVYTTILTPPSPLPVALGTFIQHSTKLGLPQKRSASLQIQPPNQKRRSTTSSTASLSSELGEYIAKDTKLFKRLGWKKFVEMRRGEGDLGNFSFDHPAKRLLVHYKHHGAPVKFSSAQWNDKEIKQALQRGAHKSCNEHIDFIQGEFVDMIKKGQWVVLPFNTVKKFKDLRLSPPGCIPQRDRRPRWIVDYSYFGINKDTLPLAALESMQFGHALDRLLREILLANPTHGPVYLMKLDIADGFYRIALNIDDIPKLGVIFPTSPGDEPLVAQPLVLPMGWTNSPPIFTTATETIADIANQRLASSIKDKPHHFDELAHHITPQMTTVNTNEVLPSNALPAPKLRDPSLPTNSKKLQYVDVFVDDFLALVQGKRNQRRVRRILMEAVDDVFRPLHDRDNPFRTEPISIKKLSNGDCSWGTCKNVLGWIINTIKGTIQLPPHRVERLSELLSSIPRSQKRISARKWYKVLGELRSMSLALPGSRNLFSLMQLALTEKVGQRVSLKKGVHQALDDFRWMLNDITKRPTRIAEIVPLNASAVGHHDASGKGSGGVWFPSAHIQPRQGFEASPILWRVKWPEKITSRLITEDNPGGSITIADLELAGGLLQLEALCQTYDIRERTVLSKTDNLATLFWQRKGSATTDQAPASLLRLFGIHQRFHRYVPRHDYLSGPSNNLADDASRLFSLNDSQFLLYFNSKYPQKSCWQMWTPSPQILSALISALLKIQSKPESLLVEPNPPSPPGNNGKYLHLSWPLIPYSKPSKIKYQSYKSLPIGFEREHSQQKEIPSALDRLRITYGSLHRRSLVWGPQIHV